LAWLGQQKTWATKKAHKGPLVKRQSRKPGYARSGAGAKNTSRRLIIYCALGLLEAWRLGDDDAEVNLARRETLIRQMAALN
jgi:hypothetical protein